MKVEDGKTILASLTIGDFKIRTTKVVGFD
jgi:hypothetical protein